MKGCGCSVKQSGAKETNFYLNDSQVILFLISLTLPLKLNYNILYKI